MNKMDKLLGDVLGTREMADFPAPSLTITDEQMTEITFYSLRDDLVRLEYDITSRREEVARGVVFTENENKDWDDIVKWYEGVCAVISFYAKPKSKYWNYKGIL